MISKEDWCCEDGWCGISIHIITKEKLDELTGTIFWKLKELKKNGKVEKCYFMRYAIGKIYLQIGLFNADELAITQINDIIKNFKSKNYLKYTEGNPPDKTSINGVIKEEIKCISFEMFEILSNNIKKIDIDHIADSFHFLTNQLSLGYEQELKTYFLLFERLQRQLKILGIDTIVPCPHNEEKDIRFIKCAVG